MVINLTGPSRFSQLIADTAMWKYPPVDCPVHWHDTVDEQNGGHSMFACPCIELDASLYELMS